MTKRLSLQNGTNEIICLDLMKSFDINSPPWEDMTKTIGLPVLSYNTHIALGGKNNSFIFMYSGIEKSLATFKFQVDKLLYIFDTNTKTWSVPTTANLPQKPRDAASFTSDGKGNIYLYGGYELNETSSTLENPPALNDAYVFNTISLSWTSLNPSLTLLRRAKCSSVFLNDGRILYIGGESSYGVPYNMTSVYVYNTVYGMWSEENVDSSEVIVEERIEHSSVLLSNGDIIVYGGWRPGGATNGTVAQPTLVILETKSMFRWRKQNVTGKFLHLNRHSCHIVNNRYMFVAYGHTIEGTVTVSRNELYILGTTNYTWITRFGQNLFDETISPKNSNNSLIIGFLIFTSILAAVLTVILTTILVSQCYHKRRILRIY
ncbi:21073_t:CDS:2 [Cetraspora pellucida]|uniref:21073_t:CDS:1 n=1 Tax=Cetraspora pellucida TaxID=1433469 RepID=A0A9N9EWP8_9GLOM|nr:21073_t:CDS:2 [Cetraspora pellucida]